MADEEDGNRLGWRRLGGDQGPPLLPLGALEWICHTFLLIFGERDPEKNQTKEGNKGNPVETSKNLKKVGRLNRSTAETMVVRNRHTTALNFKPPKGKGPKQSPIT